MSRVGNRPIKINEGVTAEADSGKVILKSSKGEQIINLPSSLKAKVDADNIYISRDNEQKLTKSLHGLNARLIANAIEGLSNGIKKVLEFKGTGYRARIEGQKIILGMGYSHEVPLTIPSGLEVNVVKNSITIQGADSQIVGNFAAKIREVRPPEVYKGKGIRYNYEVIKRKDGKASQGGKG